MSTSFITAKFKPGDVLTDADTAKLSDDTATFGIKRNDTDEVVVADGTDLIHDGTGLYSYSWEDPAPDLIYTVALEFVLDGVTTRAEIQKTGGTSATYPVTLTEAKAQCRVTGTDEDDLITDKIAAATEDAESYLNRTLVSRSRIFRFNSFAYTNHEMSGRGRGYIEIPYPPLQSITSITYLDDNGDSQTLDASVYQVDTVSEPGRIYLAYNQSWPTVRSQPQAVTVTAVAGYATVADIPKAWKHAILLMVGDAYEHREDTVVGPTVSRFEAAERYLSKRRIIPV